MFLKEFPSLFLLMSMFCLMKCHFIFHTFNYIGELWLACYWMSHAVWRNTTPPLRGYTVAILASRSKVLSGKVIEFTTFKLYGWFIVTFLLFCIGNSYSNAFCRKVVLNNPVEFTGNYLRQSLVFVNLQTCILKRFWKGLWHVFLCDFCK